MTLTDTLLPTNPLVYLSAGKLRAMLRDLIRQLAARPDGIAGYTAEWADVQDDYDAVAAELATRNNR